MKNITFTAIPKKVTGREELIVLPRSVFDELVAEDAKKEEILKWSHEARELRKKGKLPALKSLKDLR